MSKKVSIKNVDFYETRDINVTTLDIHAGTHFKHKVIIKTTEQYKRKLRAKILTYCQNRARVK